METISDTNICSLCGSSTDNKPFDVNCKKYVVCNCCYDVMSWVVEQILDNKSNQSAK